MTSPSRADGSEDVRMTQELFERVEQVLRSDGAEAGFDLLAEEFLREKKYPLLFEARLMKKRCELGLPLIEVEAPQMPEQKARAYEAALVQAAREAGHLFLTDGDIERAWPYFRAVGEPGPVAAAIEELSPGEGLDRIIEIAFFEQVHPRKGFELILANYGICRAITTLAQYPGRKGKQDCTRMLVRSLHADLRENLKQVIAGQEGQSPDKNSLPELTAGRDWLFGEYGCHIDSTHLASILPSSLELDDRETLLLALELAEYGNRLSPMFHYRSEPPFENLYQDHAVYLRALLGDDVDSAITHFQEKAAKANPQEDSRPAQALVGLLARLGRYADAIEVSLTHLRDHDPSQLACPTVLQLCQLAGDHRRLMEVAREKGDLLSFAAAVLQADLGPLRSSEAGETTPR